MKANVKYLASFGLALSLLALVLLGFAPPARAADFRGGEVVVIPAGEVIDDDLFVTARRVEVNGTVKGDLFAMGSEVTVNGIVEGSLFLAGQTAEVNGTVGGSVYGGGYALTVGPATAIDRNLYFGGFSLETKPGSVLGRSLYVGGYQAILAGEVARDVRAGLGALELDGRVGGDMALEVSPAEGAGAPTIFFPGMPVVRTLPPGVRFGPEAEVAGNLWYQSQAEQSIPAGSVGGAVTFATPVPAQQPEPASQPALGSALFRAVSTRIGEFVALVIVGGLLLRFWPSAVQRVSAQAQAHPVASAGWGLLVTAAFFVALPLAGIVVFAAALLGGLVTFGQLFSAILGLGAAALGLTLSAGLFILSLVTKAIVSYLAGRLALARLAPQSLSGRWGDLLALALGAAMYAVLRAIPLGLGWLIGVLVTLLGVGAIYYVAREVLRRPAPPAPVAA